MEGQRWASWVVQSCHADPLQSRVNLTCCLESPFLRGNLVTRICVIGTFRACSRPEGSSMFPSIAFPQKHQNQAPGKERCLCLGHRVAPWAAGSAGRALGTAGLRQPVCPEENHLSSQPAPATAARRGVIGPGLTFSPFTLTHWTSQGVWAHRWNVRLLRNRML